MKMSNEAYDFWKKMVMKVLPAAGACYYGLAQIWNWPYAEHVTGSITVICAFLGEFLDAMSRKYYAELEAAEVDASQEMIVN